MGEALHDLRAALVPIEPAVSVDEATIECANRLDRSIGSGLVPASAADRSAVATCLAGSGYDIELVRLDRDAEDGLVAEVIITADSIDQAAEADPVVEKCLGAGGAG